MRLILCIMFSVVSFFMNDIIASESDRILLFHSDISIQTNGDILVKETIKVYNGIGGSNDLIQRGIVRSFPTVYKTKEGFRSTVPFKLISTRKNGIPEPFHSKELENGIEFYLGSSDVYLDEGIYTYEIIYQTGKQLIFHPDKDEFYWNVNGNGWKFTAQKVSCAVAFPEGASIFEQQCYTGVMGSASQNCIADKTSSNTIAFTTTQPLFENEGLTIAAAIQKGIIKEPSKLQQYVSLFKDNWILPVLFLSMIFVFSINLLYWLKHGKDPKGGIVYPQFEPPLDMSPADVGYLLKQSYSSEHFAASIVDYAVNRKVEIRIAQEGTIFKSTVYSFHKPKDLRGAFERDYKCYQWYGYDIDWLFGMQAKKGSYNSVIAKCYNNLASQLKDRLLIQKYTSNSFKGLFKLNDGFIALGVLFIIVMVVTTFIYLVNFPNLVLLISSIVLIVVSIIIHILFSRIMSAYSEEGRKIADQVLGFKLYLETTEQHVFDELNPPEMTLQLFERYLPYAIALNCENKWSQKFEHVINSAIQNGYQPSYFSVSGSSFSSSAFTHSLASGLSSTISSASTPPSSSGGGSSGGGSSGGGGGGGGGGGW